MRRKYKKSKILRWKNAFYACGLFIVGGFFLFRVSDVYAVSFFDPSGTLGLVNIDLIELVVNILRWVLGLLGLVAVGFIIYGGIVWMTSGGSEDKIERAKKIIVNAVIGLILVLLSWAIVFFVSGTLNNLANGGPGGPGGPGGGGNLPGMEFRVSSITTTCRDGVNFRENVAKCSSIQVTFNHLIDVQTVKDAVAAKTMLVEACGTQAGGSDLSTCGNPSQLFGAPNVYDNDGALPASGGESVWLSSNNTATFYHPNQLLPGGDDALDQEQYYRLRMPRDLADQDGLKLSECKDNFGAPIPGCAVTPTEISWIFWVGEFIDSEPPAIAKSYPIFDPTDPAYPDRSVNRSPIIWAEFDEPVDGNWLANDSTVELYACVDGQSCVNAQEFSDTTYEVRSRNGIGFELQLISPALFESFAWYKIRVDNFTDLCSNVMTPKPTEWMFQTNDISPGVLQVYPQNGWPNACPNIEPFVQFTTSMYNLDTGSCVVDPTNGIVAGVTPWEGRDLMVVDNYRAGDPNQFCKQYSFTNVPGPLKDLSTGTKNTQQVTTTMVYDADGHTLTVPDASRLWPFQTWEFGVVDYDKGCINPPYLTRVEPTSGGVGQCVTVYGGNLGEGLNVSGGAPSKADVLSVGGAEADDYSKDTWMPWAIIGRIPTLSLGKKTIDVKEYFPAIDFQSTASSPFQFDVTSASGKGPCLYSISPNPQAKGGATTFLGSAFDPKSLKQELNFTAALKNAPVPGTWTDTSAQVLVPPAADSGPATVANDNGPSNPVDFIVAPPGVPLMEFSASCALARYPSPNPQVDQSNVCPNAQFIHAAFTLDMNDAALTDAKNITIQECADPTCSGFIGSPIVPERIEKSQPFDAPGEGLNFILPASLTQSATYKVTLSTRITSAEGAPLLQSQTCGMGVAYCWKFTTAAKDCAIDRLALDPENQTTNLVNADFPYTAWAYSSATCMPVNAPANFDLWASDNLAAGFFLVPKTGSTPTNTLHSAPATSDQTANLSVRETFTNLTATGKFTLDLTSCEDTAQCVKNCGATSQCIQTPSGGKCTPVIQGFDGNPGPVGGWVYVDTACAGPYVPGESTVTFTGQSGEIEGNILQQQCVPGNPNGWTWVEVPNDTTPTPSDDASDGAVKVYSTTWGTGKKDEFSSDSTKTGVGPYDVDPSITNHMVCRVEPLVQTKGGDYLLYGDALGDGTGPSDKVVFDDPVAQKRYDSAYLAWQADQIQAVTPTDPLAPTNLWYNAFVIKGGKDSKSSALAYIRPPAPGDPCDGDLVAPACQVNNALCGGPGSGLLCDPGTCSCQLVGECSDTPAPTCTVNTSICQQKYGPASTCDTGSCFCTVPNFACSKEKYLCVVDQSQCASGYSCNASCACAPIDLSVTKIDPSANEQNVCRNRSISAQFNVPVDLDSFAGNVDVQFDPKDGFSCSKISANFLGRDGRLASGIRRLFGIEDTKAAVPCTANATVSYGRDTSEVIIDPFTSVPTLRYADYTVTLKAGIRAQNGNTLGADFIYDFSTEDKLCDASRVEIQVKSTPASSDLFTCKNDTCAGDDDRNAAGNQHAYQSIVYDAENHMLVADEHVWQDSATPGAVNLTSTGCALATVCALNGFVDALSVNGLERVTVTGKAGKGSARAGLDVTTLACDNPWPVKAPYVYKDHDQSGQWFEMFFCKDSGLPNLLPADPTDLSTPVSFGNFTTDPADGTDALLREIFFPVDGAVGDVIGVRIMENEQHLDPFAWYTKQFGAPRGGSASIAVDGYEAAQIGRSVYVDAPHFVSGVGLFTNVYILSYNEGAGSDTVAIFNELLKNIHFNTETTTMPAYACNGGVDMNRDCVRRDTSRFGDIVETINLLNAFKVNNGQYPAVGSGQNEPGGSGSFVEGITTSRWPLSWSALGNAVGRALPSDPVNAFSPACGVAPYDSFDATTCWDEKNHSYICPANSKIYQYVTTDKGKTASFYNRFEYTGANNWTDPPASDPCSFSSDAECKCFNSEFLDQDWGKYLAGNTNN